MSSSTHPASGSIPICIAKLLITYLCGTPIWKKRFRLDTWILESESNMTVFEECVEESLKPLKHNPDWAKEVILTQPQTLINNCILLM